MNGTFGEREGEELEDRERGVVLMLELLEVEGEPELRTNAAPAVGDGVVSGGRERRGGRGGEREAAIGGNGRGGDPVGELRRLGTCSGEDCWDSVVELEHVDVEVFFDLDPVLSKNCPTRRKHSAGIVLMGAGCSGAMYTLLPVSGSAMTLDASCLHVGQTVVVTSLLIVPRSHTSIHDL